MSERNEFEIYVGRDGLLHRLSASALAAALRIPPSTLRETLSRLVLALSDRSAVATASIVEGEPTEGESGNVPVPNVPNVNVNVKNINTRTFGTLGNVRSDAREAEPATTPSSKPPLTAEFLARTLDDEGSRPFYDHLVATTRPELIVQALALTEARRATIRGRPAAYFTVLVRRLTSSTNPYA